MMIITFLSDFGDKDWFVSAVKGEILKINPAVRIIDICHKIKSFDIKEAAFVLKMVYKNFPAGTIHLAVVDPGVGSKRKPLIFISENYYFVGPDNGIFSYVLKNPAVFEIKNIIAKSATFHARDIFGPVAAKISLGININLLGKRTDQYLNFGFPKIKKKGNRIIGEIVYIDHFGNLITNIPVKIKVKKIYFKNLKVAKVKEFYSAAQKDEIIAVKGSSNFYEIAGFKLHADIVLKSKVGDRVEGEIV